MTKWEGAFGEIRRRSVQALWKDVAVESPFIFDASTDRSDVPDFIEANWESLGNAPWPVISLPGRDLNLVRDTLISATKFYHVIDCARAAIASGAMTWGIVDAYHSCLVGARLIFALYGILSYNVRGRTVLIDFRPEFGSKDDIKRFNRENKGTSDPIRILRPQKHHLEQSDSWSLVVRLSNITMCPPDDMELVESIKSVASQSVSAYRNEMLYDSVAWGWLDDFSTAAISKVARDRRLEDSSADHSLTLKALSAIFGFSRDRLTELCHSIGLVPSAVSPMIAATPDPLSLLG